MNIGRQVSAGRKMLALSEIQDLISKFVVELISSFFLQIFTDVEKDVQSLHVIV